MPAGNKDLMYLIANGADGAKEQHGHARGQTLHGRLEKQTTATEANNPTKKNSTVWATRRTFVPTHMRMEASRPDRTFEAAESMPPVIPFSV